MILADKIIHFRIPTAPSEVAATGLRLLDPAVISCTHCSFSLFQTAADLMNYITSIYHITPTDLGDRLKFASFSNAASAIMSVLLRGRPESRPHYSFHATWE